MNKITVWTKQHSDILHTLKTEGRHIAKKEYIVAKMSDISPFYLDVYNWYTRAASQIIPKPDDVRYPIWVSLAEESALTNDDQTVVLKIEVDASLVMAIDYEKWGYVVNYMYIPASPSDLAEHQKLLRDYGVDDPHAYMSNFYPAIKRKIIKSWDRLFDNSTPAASPVKMGTIWEIRSEWITAIT